MALADAVVDTVVTVSAHAGMVVTVSVHVDTEGMEEAAVTAEAVDTATTV